MNERRFEIGTLDNDGNFQADTISSDPELTGFPTLHLAIQEMREVIQQARKMSEPMTNGAVYDREWNQVVWRQDISTFEATHVITLDSGERIEVQLEDGAAHTRDEWDSATSADYERQDNGDWTFQGQPFAGTVKEIK